VPWRAQRSEHGPGPISPRPEGYGSALVGAYSPAREQSRPFRALRGRYWGTPDRVFCAPHPLHCPLVFDSY